MWKLYTRFNPESIAIQTTYQRLQEEIANYPYVKIGRVSYVKYDQKLDVPDSYFWYKRKSFEHEREVCVMTVRCPITNIELFEMTHPRVKITRMVHHVSLDNLIENFYISPLAPRWLRKVVKAELKQHNLSIEPKYSDLNAEPEFELKL